MWPFKKKKSLDGRRIQIKKDDLWLTIEALDFLANILSLLTVNTRLLGLTGIHQASEVDSGKVGTVATSYVVRMS